MNDIGELPVNKRSHLPLFFVLLVTFIPFLIGCGADVDQTISFYRNEAWEADMSLSIPAETMTMLGDPAQLDAEMDQAVLDAEKMGAKASWDSLRDGTTLIYSFHVQGEGLETLKEIAFDSGTQLAVEEVEGKRQIFLSHPGSSDFLSANQYTLTIHAGEIISSNGQEVDKGVVRWTNPSRRIEAVFTEKGRFSLGTLLLVISLVLGLGGGGWFFWQQRNQHPVQLAAVCQYCAQSLASQAQFCPKCGQKR